MRFVSLAQLPLALLVSNAAAQVSGTVRDAATLEPIPGARVTVQATDVAAFAGANGAFNIEAVSGDVVVVAGAQGWFEGGQAVTAPAADVALVLERVPQWDDPSYQFPSPSACSTCHPLQYAGWQGSPMSRAGGNTWVYDTYDGTGTELGMGGFVYLRDSSLAPDNPASECRACHQPEPWISNPYSALEPIGAPSEGATHGISCVVCHQVADVDDTKPSFPGIWPGVVAFQRPPAGQVVMYGVLGDVTYQNGGLMRPAYQPELTSLVCAACHQDKNDPDLDGDFEEDNGVISEPTYLEWLASPYADRESPSYATCATCHMPPSSNPAACAVLPDVVRPEGDVREHTFRGTDAQFLEHALSLDLSAGLDDGEVTATVTLTNDQAGHHVPTGVTVRNVILVVEAFRLSNGAPLNPTGEQVVHDLGGVGDPEHGYLAGLPGKLYAKVNHDANGDGPTFFTDAAGITFDTRIPALASDVTHYTFRVPEQGGEVGVRARVVYRRAWRALVDAKGWTEDGHGAPLEDVAAPYFGHVMASAEATIDVPPATGGSGDGGGGARGAGGAGQGNAAGTEGSDSGCDCMSGRRSASGDEVTFAAAMLFAVMLRLRSRR